MFTGIVEEVGQLKAITRRGGGVSLSIAAHRVTQGLTQGESIAVNGVCLTVVDCDAASFRVDVSPETLRRTNLGALRTGDGVNLERALRLGERLGGHYVTGHVDGTGTITRKVREGNALNYTIRTSPEILRYIVAKGSIAVDGISLTVVSLEETSFSVSIIPHTAQVTTLGKKGPGDMVNLECDLLGKYVEKFLHDRREKIPGISRSFLAEHGYL